MYLGKERAAWERLKGFHTASEICQQPVTWRKTIAQLQTQREELQAFIQNVCAQPDYDIVLCGAGTSEFIGNALFSYLNRLHKYRVKSYATTELVAAPRNYLSADKPTLLVSFGRSGNSPESLGAVNAANAVCKDSLYHLFITCNAQGALAKTATTQNHAYAINLCEETHDQAFAMTSSYTNMMLAALLSLSFSAFDTIVAKFSDIITRAEAFLNHGWQSVQNVVEGFDFERIVYLGANVCKGSAQEAALKMLELSAGRVCTMFDSPLGFRHGPKSIINDRTLCVVFVSQNADSQRYELDLLAEMKREQKQNHIIALSAHENAQFASFCDEWISFGNEVVHDNMLLAFEYILFAQILALYKSIALGITPDDPCPSGEVNRVVQGVTIYPFE